MDCYENSLNIELKNEAADIKTMGCEGLLLMLEQRITDLTPCPHKVNNCNGNYSVFYSKIYFVMRDENSVKYS